MIETIKKGGLVLSSDGKHLYSIDSDSSEFHGLVPNGVVSIEEDAFSCCNLTEIILPESVEELGSNLFCNSKKLEHVKLPSKLRILSAFMFCGCSNLKKVEMPLEVDSFPEGLFADCSSLEEIPFRGGIKFLEENVFSNCTSLKSLIIPDSVEKIAQGAITGCSSLRTIVLPASLKVFEQGAITDCDSLTRIRISDDNPLFYTSEDGRILYKKNAPGPSGDGLRVFEVANKVQNELPSFNEIEETDNRSIIDYDNEEDQDDTSILFQNDKELNEGKQIEKNINESKGETTMEENTQLSSDMEARLAEIMGQEKQYGEGEFTIMDIPEASEEEMEASKLESSGAHPEFERTMQIPKPVVPLSREEADNSKSMEERISEIIEQNQGKPGFSIMDIPAASQREIEEDRIVSEGDFAAGVEDEDAPLVPEIPEAQLKATEALYEDDEKAVMHNLFFEAKKVEQINLDLELEEQRILYVFAQNLALGQFGKIFSKRLVKCVTRLAEIHKYSSIFLFSGVDLRNEKFRNQFTRYMKDKDIVIACAAETLASLDENTKVFAQCANISLDKDFLEEQVRLARSSGSECLKLLIQDNLSE